MAKKDAVARETPTTDTALNVQTPPEVAPRVDRGGDVAVWMPPERSSGVRAFGDLLPGIVYRVPAAEAHRLVTVKRFRFADAAAQAAVSNHIDGIADAAIESTRE